MIRAYARTSLMGRYQLRWLMLTMILVATSLGVISYSGAVYRMDLQIDFERHTKRVGQAVSVALTDVLDSEAVLFNAKHITTFFDDQMERHAQVKYFGLVDRNGTFIFSTEPKPDDMFLVGRQIEAAGIENVSVVELSDLHIHVHPVYDARGDLRSGLVTGTQTLSVATVMRDNIATLFAMFMVAIVLTIKALSLATHACVVNHMSAVRTAMNHIMVGDFRARLSVRTNRMTGKFPRLLNDVIDRFNSHYEKVQGLVGPAQQGADAEAAAKRKKLGAHISQLLNRMHFASDTKTFIREYPRASDVLFPLFLMAFAEALSASYFPRFVSGFENPSMSLDQEFFIGLPIAFFFFCVLVFMPIGLALSKRFSLRSCLAIGFALAIIGFTGLAFTESYQELLGWRALGGFSCVLIYVASQQQLLQMWAPNDWGHAALKCVVTILPGTSCGLVMGGILVDKTAFSGVYFVAALIALLGLFSSRVLLETPAQVTPEPPSTQPKASWLSVFKNGRLVIILTLAVLPQQLVFSGVLLYLAPVVLDNFALQPSYVAFVMVVYFIFFWFLTPLFSWLSENLALHILPVFVGGLLSCAGFLIVYQWLDSSSLLIALCALGIGHAMTTAPLQSLVVAVCETETEAGSAPTIIQAVRAFELTGFLLGPLVAATFLWFFGTAVSFALFGLVIIFCSTLLVVTYFSAEAFSKNDDIPSV